MWVFMDLSFQADLEGGSVATMAALQETMK